MSERLNKTIKKKAAVSAAFWADKPKMTSQELSAIDAFARKKTEQIDKAFSGYDMDAAIKKASKK